MQLILNTESTDTEKMSTIEPESLIEKPFVNGSPDMNDVIKAIDDHKIPIANKENILVEENKIINTDENRNPDTIQELRDDDKVIVHTKEEPKISSDDTEPVCPVIENGVRNATHEIDGNKSQSNYVDEIEASKTDNVKIKYNVENNAENETVADGDKNDEDSIVKVVKPVRDTQILEETEKTKNDSLKERKIIENFDVDQEAKVIVSEVKETNNKLKESLQETLLEVTVPVHDSVKNDASETNPYKGTNDSNEVILDLGGESLPVCTNDGESANQEIVQTSTISEDSVHGIIESDSTIILTGDGRDIKETSVDVADVSDDIKISDSENAEIVKKMLNIGDITEVVNVEKNNSAQLMEDIEIVSAECKGNDNADVNTEEKSKCTLITEDVEMLSTEDKNKDDADIQGITKMDVSDNGNAVPIESSRDIENDVEDKFKNDGCSEITTMSTDYENVKTDISTSPKKNNSVEVKNNFENETKDYVSTVNDIVDLDEVKIVEDDHKKDTCEKNEISSVAQTVGKIKRTTTIRLSNTLDILSDDDEDPVKTTSPEPSKVDQQKVTSPEVLEKCINLDDDDDIMLIDDITSSNDKQKEDMMTVESGKLDCDPEPVNSKEVESSKMPVSSSDLDSVIPEKPTSPKLNKEQIVDETPEEVTEKPKPLIPDNFFKTFKKNLAEMTRDDLEEFCILKIVESIIERSNLNDIKSKLKTMALCLEEYKKKAMMLTKQNRDLQVVLKSIQEELKKKSGTAITPLKITRSVGMQVIMPDKNRRKGTGQNSAVIPNTNTQTNVTNNTNRPQRNSNQNQRLQKQASNSQSIPVPRLVPASNTNVTNKPAPTTTTSNAKAASSLPNGAKNSTVTPKSAEKRTHNRVQSVTVDLTDDEPPAKQAPKNSPVPPVRLVPSQNSFLATRQQFTQNSPRKVYIPISGPQAQNIRPGQTVMLKNVPTPAPKTNRPPMVRLPQSSMRSGRAPNNHRHPAPLPDAMKQYQPPNWKALPPAPDLKLSKVENGIVISWKIDGYQDDSYEEIASYQLYAYQETSTPPNTALWKKIGDVKALPLPMACTLTQFMAGYKYYFAVRAVDIRSRVGPFSLPGSILLLNKM